MSNRSDPAGYVRLKDRIPYHGRGVDDLIAALRRVLTENKYAQKVVLEVGAPHIYIEKLVPQAEAQDLPPQVSLHDIVRTAEMEEYDNDEERTSIQQIWDMFAMINERGLQAAVIVAGNKAKFQKWLGFRLHHSKPVVFETPFQVLGELPEDVFIVCGAPTRIADIDDIKYSVKGTI